MTKILIEVNELVELMQQGNIHIVDTRSPEEFAQSHIAGAANIHDIFTYLSSSTKEGLVEMRAHFAELFGKAGIDENDTVVFYESGMNNGYGQSFRGHFMLSYLGNDNSLVLHGGLAAWTSAGHALTDEVSPFDAKEFKLNDRGLDLIVDKDDVLASLDDPNVTLLDVRDVDEWIGESSSPYGKDFVPRKGRLPGAKWLEWYRMMKPTSHGQRLKSGAEVRAEASTIGLEPEHRIFLYCFKGARTSNTYVALKQAGFDKVSTYFGSWNEWSRDESLPIDDRVFG